MNELVATGAWQNSALAGDFGIDWPDYSWTAELQAWGQGQGVEGTNTVQELDVHVSWKGQGQQQATVSTLVYQSPNATASTGVRP